MAGRHRRKLHGLGFAVALGALGFAACATSGSHQKSPASESKEASDDDRTYEDTDSDAKPTPRPANTVRESAGDAKRSEAAAPSQGDDVHAVLQLAVDDQELDQYLKLGEPGRFPLKIAGSAVPQNIELIKATKPVVVTSPPSNKKDAVLVVTDIDIKGNDATVSYRYDIEGIRGTAYLKKSAHGWELTRSRIVEH
ncbi:MAG TPA: hypothetical protein VGQ57_16860 [Polyangiaceae bacterium]|nr:hypothetical protein [Polyangiaceae bacterium]